MKKALAAIALLGLAVRIDLLLRGIASVDRLFIPDDTYYTLAIARSLAHGLGPTADGVTLTSGFQPLIAFLLVPLFWFTRSLDVPVYAACAVGSAADALSTWLIGTLAARIGGWRAGVASALLWALSSLAIANALNGLETALAVSLELAFVASWLSARKRATPRAFVVCGVLGGFALLSRIDAIFLIGILIVFELVHRRFREAAIGAGAALAVVAPWWLYCVIHFGSPIPASGDAVHHLVALHREQYLSVPWALGWAAGSVLTSPFFEAPGLSELASSDAIFGVGLWAVALLAGLLFTRRFFARKTGWLSPYVAFAAFGATLFALYSLYLPALWFFRRYFAPVHAFAALAVGVLFALCTRKAKSSFAARSGLGLFVAAAFLLLTKTGLFLILKPTASIDAGLHGAKGYRAAARDVLALTPRSATLGALQSGALSYYANGCPSVVGLDGVVDPNAARAVRERALSDYAARRGVTHFADWPYNQSTFAQLSERSKWKPAAIEPLGSARPQGSDQFEVARITWPAEMPQPRAPANRCSP